MEHNTTYTTDIEKNKELFAYEMTEVLLKLKGEFAVVSGKDTRYQKTAVDRKKLAYKPTVLPQVACDIKKTEVPNTAIGEIKLPDVRSECSFDPDTVPAIPPCAVTLPDCTPAKGLRMSVQLPQTVLTLQPVCIAPVETDCTLSAEIPQVAQISLGKLPQADTEYAAVDVPVCRTPDLQTLPKVTLENKPLSVSVPTLKPFGMPALRAVTAVSAAAIAVPDLPAAGCKQSIPAVGAQRSQYAEELVSACKIPNINIAPLAQVSCQTATVRLPQNTSVRIPAIRQSAAQTPPTIAVPPAVPPVCKIPTVNLPSAAVSAPQTAIRISVGKPFAVAPPTPEKILLPDLQVPVPPV